MSILQDVLFLLLLLPRTTSKCDDLKLLAVPDLRVSS